MIQRIQSLYLILIVIAQSLITQFNFVNFTVNGVDFNLNSNGIIDAKAIHSTEDSKQLILIVLAILFAIISLALFKNRALQIKFTKFISFVCLIQASFVGISTYHFFESNVENLQLGVASFLILISGILAVLATKAIKKDDDLVKSVDRIR